MLRSVWREQEMIGRVILVRKVENRLGKKGKIGEDVNKCLERIGNDRQSDIGLEGGEQIGKESKNWGKMQEVIGENREWQVE